MILKSKIKKYLPKPVYVAVYFFYKLFQKPKDLKSVGFIKSKYAKINIDDVSYSILIDPDNGTIDKEIYLNGAWESDILKEIKRHINKESVCVDIGANIGVHSLYMSLIAKEVHAFEPIKKLVNQINQSQNKNNIKNLKVYNFGLSDQPGEMNIYLDNLNIGRSTLQVREEASGVEKVNIKVFDSIWDISKKISFVKIDVEGYEYNVLCGMKKSLEAWRPVCIIEYTPLFYRRYNQNLNDIPYFLFGLGYKLYDLSKDKNKITKENLDEFIKNTPVQTDILCIYGN